MGYLDKHARLSCLAEQFATQGIALSVVRKRVKHINFRVRLGKLLVSAPRSVSDDKLAVSIAARFDWAVAAQLRLSQMPHYQDTPLLWGEPLDRHAWAMAHLSKTAQIAFIELTDSEQFTYIAKTEIARVLPDLHHHWQAVVGKSASSLTVRTMTSRWGSCNTRTARISLSTHLARFPIDCLAYVLVHELCHLIHPNHSAAFWAEVAQAMPDYRRWHDLLKGRGEL